MKGSCEGKKLKSKSKSLDEEDRTPSSFKSHIKNREIFKDHLRRIVYPIFTSFRNRLLKKQYRFARKYDKVFLGQRGNDYRSHRLRVNKLYDIKNSNILIIGCGIGRDLESWAAFRPNRIIAVDYFNYEVAWKEQINYLKRRYDVDVEFHQADVANLDFIPNESVDIIGSDAVLEHLSNLSEVLPELRTKIVTGGIFYSTFGPLWNTWGGDHVSGQDHLSNGFNHLLLDHSDYSQYLKSFGPYKGDQDDSRLWIYNDLFSYLKPDEYLHVIENNFSTLWTSVLLDHRAIQFTKSETEKTEKLIGSGLTIEEILVSGMSIIAKKNN